MGKGKKQFKIEAPRGTISTYTITKGNMKGEQSQDSIGIRDLNRIMKMVLQTPKNLLIRNAFGEWHRRHREEPVC